MMNRRTFLLSAAASPLLAAGSAMANEKQQRPNILLIMTDQQAFDAMSCAGNEWLKTPNMDSLAARGTRFTNAYSVQPLCMPFRTSLQTGLYPHQTGVDWNNYDIELPEDTPMLGAWLRDAGYDCKYVGKWHVPRSQKRRDLHGYDFVFSERRPDDVLADAAVGYLRAAPEEPFFLTVSLNNPHDVCQVARREALPMGPIPELTQETRLPPLPENHLPPKHEPSVVREIQQWAHEKLYPTQDWDEHDWREYLWMYYRLVEKVDAEIGRVLAALREAGHEDDTLVIFLSDHGEGTARHGWNQKQVLYEAVAHVPLIMAGPGVPQGAAEDIPVSPGIDLFPTLADIAGAEPPRGLPGQSLRLLRDAPGDYRDCVVAETRFAAFNIGPSDVHGRALRCGPWKYIIYSRGKQREQLFNLADDPGEMRDLAVSPAHAAQLYDMRNRLAQWADEWNDPFRQYLFSRRKQALPAPKQGASNE